MIKIENKNVFISNANIETKLFFLQMIEKFNINNVEYYEMCKKNINDFFNNCNYMKKCNYTLIKNDDVFYIVVFNDNEFKIISYEINENFEFVCFDIKYVYNVYDLFSQIF